MGADRTAPLRIPRSVDARGAGSHVRRDVPSRWMTARTASRLTPNAAARARRLRFLAHPLMAVSCFGDSVRRRGA